MGDSARLRSTGSSPDSVFPLDDYEFRIHGVKVHALQTDNLVTLVHQWLRRSDKNNRQFHYLVSTNINNVTKKIITIVCDIKFIMGLMP